MDDTRFWTLQKKIYALALTVVAVGAACVAVVAGANKVNDSIDSRIRCQSERVADSLDSIQQVKRFPIDSAILAKLDRIGTDIKRTTYFQEQSMSEADYSKARALWVRDSIRWRREDR
jgi:hypothetical protein